MQNHARRREHKLILGVRGRVSEEAKNVVHDATSGVRLAGAYGVDSREHCGVDGASIIQKATDNFLNCLYFTRRQWGGVVHVGELDVRTVIGGV